MSVKKISSLSKINLLAALFLLFGSIGAVAFSTRVLSFEIFTNAEEAAAKGSVEDKREPKNDAKTSLDKKTQDNSKSLGGTEGKLIYGHGDAPLVVSGRGEGASAFMTSRIFAKEPALEPAPEQLTDIEEFDPAWSPDGSRIAFISKRDTVQTSEQERNREIYIMNHDGSSQQRLTGNFVAETDPSFSPDGTKIIYVGGAPPNDAYSHGIYLLDIMNPDNPTLLIDYSNECFNSEKRKTKSGKTNSIAYPGFLSFTTPNFRPNAGGEPKIIFGYNGAAYTMNPDGSGCEIFYQTQNGEATEPRYSPDGTKVALRDIDYVFDPKTNETREVPVLRIFTYFGGLIETLTPGQFYSTPVWSPDGNKIAFFSGEDYFYGGYYIGAIDVNTSSEDTFFVPQYAPVFNGLSWGIPSTTAPEISLRINQPHPVEAGTATQGTVTIDAPAPAGGATVNLSCLCAVGAMTIPSTVTISEGQTQAAFPITTTVATSYTSQDILAQRNFKYAYATVTIKPSTPDLKAVAFTAPATASVNQSFSVSWTVQNIGPVSTGGSYTDEIVFSTDNVIDEDDPAFGTTSQPSLAAGASKTTTKNVSIPGAIVPQAGNYYLIFVTNRNESRNENGKTANNFIVRPIQINLPDLTVENVVAPATVEPGVSYTIQWTVRNTGTAATNTASSATVYYSNDNIAGNSDDDALSTITTPILAVGATAAQSASVTIPTVPVRPTGTGFYYVKVDSGNQIYEGMPTGAGETNNTIFKSVQFDYKVPDLQIASISVAPEVETDTEFSIGWTTTNTGNKDATNFSESVYYSPDNLVNGNDVLLGTFPLTDGLAAGQSISRIQNVTIPTGTIQTGNYFLYVRTDSSNRIDEGEKETNNVRFQPTRVRKVQRPDLQVTFVSAPPTVLFDQTLQVQWTVTNSGQGATNTPQWTDAVYIGTGTTLTGTTRLATVQSITALNPGESYTASATVKIPRGLTGTYRFIVNTDVSNTVNEDNQSNNLGNSTTMQVNAPPLPDFTVPLVQSPDQAFAGDAVDISYQVRNLGTASGSGAQDRIYFSRDTTLNTSEDTLVFTSDSFSLAANQTVTRRSANVRRVCANSTNRGIGDGVDAPSDCQDVATLARVPSNLSGLYYVFVVTDASDRIYEFNSEGNNFNYDLAEPGSPINILITPPDLVIPNQPTAPATAASGQSLSVSFTVKNQGAFNAASGLYHAVYLSADQTFDDADTLLGSINDTNIFAPAAEHPMTLNTSLPYCLANGTYYLIAVADYDKRQTEFDPGFDAEANNAGPARAIQLSTVPPDLQVSNLQIPPGITPGQLVSISYTVTNTGGAAIGRWNDRIALHSTDSPNSPQTLASVEREGGLAAGAAYTQTRSVSLPQYMQGAYFLSVTTDNNNYVRECGAAEQNNQTSSPAFSVQNNLPDLVVDAVSAPATAIVGDAFNVQWTGRNANSPMPDNSPTWNDTVYLSSDQTLDNGDVAIGGSLNELILAGGQTYQQQAQARTGNIPAGTYYVLVSADSGRHIYEGTSSSPPETNNVRASTQITLTVPAVDLQVGNVTVTPPFYSGTNIGVSWTVTNSGTTQTLGANWSDYVILSRDSVYDPSDRVLGYQARNEALAGGASYTASGNYFVPTGLTGDYSIFVITDYTNRIIESNNSNNTTSPFAVNLVPPPPSDLNITNVTPPASVNLGERATFSWTVQNSGANAVNGKWRDTVYLSRDTFWDASDVLIARKDFDSQITPVAANGGTYSGISNDILPPIEEGTYYVIVRTDAQNRIRESNEGNNLSTSAAITTVTITELQMNTPFNTTLENGATKFFKYTPPPVETLVVSLVTNMPARSNELLTNFGQVVSPADYDFQGSRPGEGNQENVIPETGEGKYYSLVRHDTIPVSFAKSFDKSPSKSSSDGSEPIPAQNITVKAQILPFSVRKVSPEVAGNQGKATIFVEGAKFQTGATVKLIGAGGSQIAPSITRVSTSKIGAIFDLQGKPLGDYDVVVTNPGGATTTLEDGFEIVQGTTGGHSLRQDIVGPDSLRAGFTQRTRYTFTAGNDGLNDAFAVPMIISFPSNAGWQLDRSNYFDIPAEYLPNNAVNPNEVVYEIEGRKYMMLILPILRSRSTININVEFTIPASSPFQVGVAVLPPILELFGNGSLDNLRNSRKAEFIGPQSGMEAPTATAGEIAACYLEAARAMTFAILNVIPGSSCVQNALEVMTPFVDVLSGIALGVSTGTLSDSNLASSAGGFVISCIKNALDCLGNEVAWVKYLDIAYSFFFAIKQLVECINMVTFIIIDYYYSFDPNEKIGPAGYGAERFVPIKKPLLYRINFENVAAASGPAQRVFVSDELPPTLDPRTVRLKEIGFKQNRYVVPENQAFYQSRVQLGADLNNLQAGISAGLDIVNRRVTWTLEAIDPGTGESPVDPTFGLLPPNNANHDGEGYLTFTVEPTETAPTRTEISNLASIVFDANEPIITNVTSNLLDSGIPTSVLSALPATSNVPSFTLNWSGSDDATGSGLQGYEVWYSADGGPYLQFVSNSTETSATFNGDWGKSYRFYSVARDNAGNVEMPPNQPDAQIQVLGGDIEADVAPRPNGNDGQVSSADLIQIRRFVAGLDSDYLYNEFQRADTAPLVDKGDGALSPGDIIQARRFAAGLDAVAEAAGPNEALSFTQRARAKDNPALLPREIRPLRVNRIDNKLLVAIQLEAQGDEVGVGFSLNFNTAHLTNPSNVRLGSGAGNAALTVNTLRVAQGQLGILLDKSPTDPILAGARQLVLLEFDIVSGAPPSTTLSFGNAPVFQEVVNGSATPVATTFAARSVSLMAPTAATVSIAGRVLANNQGVYPAFVDLTDAAGERRIAPTNPSGNYRFDNIAVSQTYFIAARSKRHQFESRVINVTEDLTGFDFTAR